MTSPADLVQPPRIATRLVNLFSPSENGESILGDLLEEYSHLASKSGVPVARRWYWRQAVKTITHLVDSGFCVAPWSTTAVVVGGFLLLRFVSRLPERAIFAVLERYQVPEHHFDAYVFLCDRRYCDRTRLRVVVRRVCRRVGGQGKGDGGHNEARSRSLGDDCCSFFGVGGQRTRLDHVGGAMVLR